jgi:hypothetical protein
MCYTAVTILLEIDANRRIPAEGRTMYKEIIDLKNRSRNYRVQKEKLTNYRENSPYLSDPRYLMRTGADPEANAKTRMEYDFIHFEIALLTENVESVERDFKLIENISGVNAADAIKRNFIDGESWEHIAEQTSVSRRTMSRMQDKWYSDYHAAYENAGTELRS